MEVSDFDGGFANSIKKFSPPLFRKFEHELHCGGGSGDSGGIFSILITGFNLSKERRSILE